ncbi:Gfo/Idh/MocA family protein [Granulosicoccus sp. 3-233]|uniref:Gfo/Idh/MocA family protein n=1 Tax=Granulosicoccus sp. 3-233 TaxID=3417969 RepID=UPI003D340B77
MSKPIALVGIGKIARDQHIPAIHADPDWSLAATVSRNASVEGIENYPTLDALLAARPDIDTVSLAIPVQPRFEHARLAIEAGRHVMLEKPPGVSVAECLNLQVLAQRQGVSLYATWHARHAEGIAEARDWLAGRRLRSLRISWKEDVRVWHPGQEWVWEPGGLGVFDPGINALSILTSVLPEPVHLNAATLDVPENRQTPIAASLSFQHSAGACVEAEFDWRLVGDPEWQIMIETDDGSRVLSFGAASMDIEYRRLYQRMAELVVDGTMDMDLSPLMHVADAFMLGRRRHTDPFFF